MLSILYSYNLKNLQVPCFKTIRELNSYIYVVQGYKLLPKYFSVGRVLGNNKRLYTTGFCTLPDTSIAA